MALTYHLKVKVTRDARKILESCGEIEANKIKSCTDDQIGNLGDSLGTNESNPVIGFRLKISV
jgi:hypothetical protein